MAFGDNPKQSVGALVPVLILGDLFAIAYYRRHAQWRRLWELFPFVVVGMLPGYLFLRQSALARRPIHSLFQPLSINVHVI